MATNVTTLSNMSSHNGAANMSLSVKSKPLFDRLQLYSSRLDEYVSCSTYNHVRMSLRGQRLVYRLKRTQ